MSDVKLVSIAGGAPPESRVNAASFLRELATAIEQGQCNDFVVMHTKGGNYHYKSWTTYVNAIAMASMAHHEAILEMRR